MQAWKSSVDISRLNTSYPSYYFVSALGQTTAEWGLQPLDDNQLVTIPNSWADAQARNDTVQTRSSGRISVLVLPTCDSGTEDPYCFTVIEGVGQTTIGSTNSNIASVAYGVVSLLTILITVAIMGCFHSTPSGQKMGATSSAYEKGIELVTTPVSDPVESTLPSKYNPSQSVTEKRRIDAERTATEQNTMREIQKCGSLLREMYRLDLEIWGTEGGNEDERSARDDMMRRSNAIFAEVQRIAQRWRYQPQNVDWTEEEAQVMAEILHAIAEQPALRYTID